MPLKHAFDPINPYLILTEYQPYSSLIDFFHTSKLQSDTFRIHTSSSHPPNDYRPNDTTYMYVHARVYMQELQTSISVPTSHLHILQTQAEDSENQAALEKNYPDIQPQTDTNSPPSLSSTTLPIGHRTSSGNVNSPDCKPRGSSFASIKTVTCAESSRKSSGSMLRGLYLSFPAAPSS